MIAPWMERAACAGQPTVLWFPPAGERGKDACEICQICPVQEPCLDYALQNDCHGIWGGTSERERARIKSRRSRAWAVAS